MPHLIPVRLTPTLPAGSPPDPDAPSLAMTREALRRVLAGGLVIGGDMTWFATQEELDLPHISFRLSPRD